MLKAFHLQNGYTALVIAVDMNNMEMVRLLLDQGANIEATEKVTIAFNTIILSQEIFLVSAFLFQNGVTALIIAVDTTKTEMVRLLLKKGANMEAADKVTAASDRI